MAKRKTLPKNFNELLKAGDMEALKAVFTKCEINAVTNRYGSNAFERGPLPREFAFWLKEQGGDVNQPDHYGEPPIFSHASAAYYGDVALLLELGADANAIGRNRLTPLHSAAMYGRIDAVDVLLKHGVNVNARTKYELSDYVLTPLEITLQQNRPPINILLIICKSLIDAGAEITETAKELLAKIGEDFEYSKARYANSSDVKEQFAEQEAGMQSLYALFSLSPAEPILLDIHDGVSKIVINTTNTDKAYKKLWDYLVPPSGIAKTAQGEVIRIVGKVCRELLHNGGINWDSDFKNMLDVLPKYFQMGNALPEKDLDRIQAIVKKIYNGSCNKICEDLTPYSVAWVAQNPDVLPLITPTYKR